MSVIISVTLISMSLSLIGAWMKEERGLLLEVYSLVNKRILNHPQYLVHIAYTEIPTRNDVLPDRAGGFEVLSMVRDICGPSVLIDKEGGPKRVRVTVLPPGKLFQ